MLENPFSINQMRIHGPHPLITPEWDGTPAEPRAVNSLYRQMIDCGQNKNTHERTQSHALSSENEKEVLHSIYNDYIVAL